MPIRSARRLCAALTLALVATACGDDTPTDPIDPPRVIKANPAFQADVQEIFDRVGCSTSGCHGSAARAGLDLRTGSAWANLVDVTATNEAVSRVIPGDAQASYLVIKLEGRQTVGSRMPLGGTPLDNIDLTNVRNWIDNGAPNN